MYQTGQFQGGSKPQQRGNGILSAAYAGYNFLKAAKPVSRIGGVVEGVANKIGSVAGKVKSMGEKVGFGRHRKVGRPKKGKGKKK